MLDRVKYQSVKLYYNLIKYFSPVLLYWYRHSRDEENLGDFIGPYLIREISEIKILHVDDFTPKKYLKYQKVYLTVGSILFAVESNTIVWGSGIIDSKQKVKKGAKYLAVRGPRTRKALLEQGDKCPEIYGDPALLLPLFYKIKSKKRHQFTIIPHYVDYDDINLSNFHYIDKVKMLSNDFDLTMDSIVESNFIISSSLHGLILAVAYNIPCVWIKLSDKLTGDDIKFYDFFESLDLYDITCYNVIDINEFILEKLPKIKPILLEDRNKIKSIQKNLLDSYPFKIKNNIPVDG